MEQRSKSEEYPAFTHSLGSTFGITQDGKFPAETCRYGYVRTMSTYAEYMWASCWGDFRKKEDEVPLFRLRTIRYLGR